LATIVLHRPTKKRYLVIGSGFGAQQPRRSVAFGMLGPEEKIEDLVLVPVGGTQGIIAVCGDNGEIGWLPSDELRVIEIDGKPPEQWLKQPNEGGPYR
jgi:hypothetical protein